MTENIWKTLLVLLGIAVISAAGCLPSDSVAEKKSERDVDAQVDKVLDDFKGQ